jgi:hypothetical protein
MLFYTVMMKTLKELHKDDKPREKLVKKGVESRVSKIHNIDTKFFPTF